MEKLRQFFEIRSGELKLQEKQFVHVGVELSQDDSFSVTLTQKEFAEKLQPLCTSLQPWAARQKLVSPEDAKLCQPCHQNHDPVMIRLNLGLVDRTDS